MLDELRHNYENYADAYTPGWRKIDKNTLCIKYSKTDDKLSREQQIPAIVSKFWYVLDIFSKKNRGILNNELAYDVYIDSLTYVLERAVWNNEDSTVYNDEKAPERCLVTRMKTQRLNKIRDICRYKELANINPISIDTLEDEYGTYTDSIISQTDNDDVLFGDVKFAITRYMQKKQYLTSLVVYILSTSPYPYGDSRWSRFLYKQIYSINEKFCEEFANMLGMEKEFISSVLKPFTQLTKRELDSRVVNIMNQLRNRSEIREMLNAY